MTTLPRVVLALVITGVLGTRVAAQGEHQGMPTGELGDLGELTFANSGARVAQPHFLRGVLLLHNFQHALAAESFRLAQQADPAFALAYWGEAMTYTRNFGREQDRAAALRVLAKLGATHDEQMAKAPTPREKAYLSAVLALYGDAPKQERDASYTKAMEQLATTYPDDLEARAFHALALISLYGRTNPAATMKAAAIAEDIFAINPRHPGAAHYLIHAYDDPVHAPLGTRAALAYSKLAPGSAHALHMPAHIFFRLGMWDESIAANVRSLSAERRSGRVGTHAMHWLVHAYLQQGRREEAAALLPALEEAIKRPELSPAMRYAKAQICGAWIVETGSDRDSPCDVDIDRTGLVAIDYFVEYEMARGLVRARRGDLPAARMSLQRIADMIASGKTLVSTESAAARAEQVTEQSLQMSALMSMQLEAAIMFAEGRRSEAIQQATEAVAKADAMPFRAEPPSLPKPPRELLGELLLSAGRYEDARRQFEAALERTPGRMHTLVGLIEALEKTGKADRAAVIRGELRRLWRGGELPASKAR